MKVWIVMHSQGEYEDRVEIPVRGFQEQEKANAFVASQVPKRQHRFNDPSVSWAIEGWYVAALPVDID